MSSSIPKMSMAAGTCFRLGRRDAICLSELGDKVLIQWACFVDQDGVVIEDSTEFILAEDLARHVGTGSLQVLSLPNVVESADARAKRVALWRPGSEMTCRALYRLSYVEVLDQMVRDGALPVRPRRIDIENRLDEIEIRRRRNLRAERKKSGKAKHAGRRETAHEECETAKTIHEWYRNHLSDPVFGVYDQYHRSGNRQSRYSEGETDFFRSVIDEMITVDRPHLNAIVESVQAAVIVENYRRQTQNPPLLPLREPGRDYITTLIKRISPVDFWTRSRGRDVTYRDLHTLGEGVQTTRALERVEIDEQTVDLFVVLRETRILDALGPTDIAALGFDVHKAHVTISAALDCHTTSLLAFQISNKPDQNLTRRTIEMIYFDKTDLAKAVGAASSWDFYGHPESLYMDKGSTYISADNWERLATAGITNMSLPGGHPFLKGNIEGWFRTLSNKHMAHLVGRTFKDVVARGENDAEGRGIIDIDTFLRWLTIWIVDVYHNTKPARAGSKSPRQRWIEAISQTPINIRTDKRRLRAAFGQKLVRHVGRQGLNVGGILYQSEPLEAYFKSSDQNDLTVAFWHRDIGEVDIQLPNGTWITAPSKDGMWEGKAYIDYEIWRMESGHEDPEERQIAAHARRAIDLEVLELRKRLNGHLPLVPSDAKLRQIENELSRFSKTRDMPQHETRALFGDVVQIEHSDFDDGSANHPATEENPDDYSDIME